MSESKKNKQLCLSLLKADSEDEVIGLLSDAGYWDDDSAWRYYGDRETNYNVIGNQSSKADVALVEKVVNSVDARLILECRSKGLDPEGPRAPQTIRSAVAEFFENGSKSATAGHVREWQPGKRTKVARGITLAATGHKPDSGNPCFTISDIGEGQTPLMLPYTILSLDRGNKIKIPFVQGKYNMGGSGVLEFCGEQNLQLVLSRRAPNLVDPNSADPSDDLWGFTVVRRENPSGGQRNSVFTYLAPVNSDSNPRKGEVLTFASESMPIFPVGNEAYSRSSKHGTLIKLYEYSTEGFSGSHILRRGGLLQKMDIRLANVALPIRLHECRSYRGGKASFDTTLSGLEVRLDDDRAKNLEDVYSCAMTIDGQRIIGSIYVFKKGLDSAYRSNEGVIFTLNGQTHGHLKKSYYGRDSVNVGYLKTSILVILNCDQIEDRPRELLFMPSRDRLRSAGLQRKIEEELAGILKSHPQVRALREKRRREELGKLLEDSKPMEQILQLLIEQSPTIAALLTPGLKLSVPFKIDQVSATEEPFEGKRYPTFFKFKGLEYGETLTRECHMNVRGRITFETDARNDYFSRPIHTGQFGLTLDRDGKESKVLTEGINLSDGIATLNLELPPNCQVGDSLSYITRTTDNSRSEPFVNEFILNIREPAKKKKRKKSTKRKPPSNKKGEDREKPSGIELPKVIEVYQTGTEDQKGWEDMDPHFDQYSALRIIRNGSGDDEDSNGKTVHDFFVNMDNLYLKHDLKGTAGDPELTRLRFANGLVLTGLAMLQYNRDDGILKVIRNDDDAGEDAEVNIEDRIEETSRAVASVLLPMIEGLSRLTEEDLDEDVNSD
ncbi:MAG: hypothetical protein ACC700_12230 [Anaerolineales bacterium]